LHFREAHCVAASKVEAPPLLGTKVPHELVLNLGFVGSRPGRLEFGDEANGVVQLGHLLKVSRAPGLKPHMPKAGEACREA